MEVLEDQVYNEEKYNLYILGSAEVVGLMCLKVYLYPGHYKKLDLQKKYY